MHSKTERPFLAMNKRIKDSGHKSQQLTSSSSTPRASVPDLPRFHSTRDLVSHTLTFSFSALGF
jgi:hypothetical protein